MPRKPKEAPIPCEFFTWRLFSRNGVWYADGRSSESDLGKHSLGTRDRKEALRQVRLLDLKKAIELGLTEPEGPVGTEDLTIAQGWELFLSHSGRPEVMGGVSPRTLKRYRAVRDKHIAFCEQERIEHWCRMNKQRTERYGRWLSGKGYADRTIYLELTLIKSIVGWLIEEKHLPESCRFRLALRRPQGTDTHCYTREQVRAMLEHCRNDPDLSWLADVIVALACTGLRISELAALRHSDLDLDSGVIRLTDERGGGRRKQLGQVRTTKGRRSRSLPIHPQLRDMIERLKPHTDGRLLHGPRGGKLKPDTVRSILVRDVILPLKDRFPTPSGEIGFEHGRVHSFRHYFVSEAFRGGASEGEIMEWVGHRDSKMVAHYRHLRDEDGHRRMRQLDFLGLSENPERADP